MDTTYTQETVKPRTRAKKCIPSTQTQKRYNENRSIEGMLQKLHINFGENGIGLHMSYAGSKQPESEERVELDTKNYFRRVRRIYRKAGSVLKYVYITDYSATGRTHIYMVLSGGVDQDTLEKAKAAWEGTVELLRVDDTGITQFLRQEDRHKFKRRYCTSRNLDKAAT